MPGTQSAAEKWYEGFKKAVRARVDIDMTKPEDTGRIYCFTKTGEVTVPFNDDVKRQLDDGLLQQALVPHGTAGYKGVSKENATNRWLLDHQENAGTPENIEALYELAKSGKLFVKDLSGQFFQAHMDEHGQPAFTDMMLQDKLIQPVKPEPPEEPVKPGIIARFLHAITGGTAYKDDFDTYEKKMIKFREDSQFYKNLKLPAYEKDVRAAALQQQRLNATYCFGISGNEDKELDQALDQNAVRNNFWLTAHLRSVGFDKELETKISAVHKEYKSIADKEDTMDRRVENVFGPKFRHLDELLKKGSEVYDPKTFSPQDYNPETAERCGLAPGEIGYLTLAAYADTEISGSEDPESTSANVHDRGVMNYYMLVDGMLVNYRQGVGNTFGNGVKEARSYTEKALSEYVKGNSRPIGEILAKGIRMQNEFTRSAPGTKGMLTQFSHLTAQIVKLVDMHPSLMDAAKKYGGLTDDELKVARGLGQVSRVQKEGMMAQEMLLKHELSMVDPSRGEKLPVKGTLNRETNYKAVQRMQAVNYAISSANAAYVTSPEYIRKSKELKDVAENAGRAGRMQDVLSATNQIIILDGSAPCNPIFRSLGGKSGAQEILNNSKLDAKTLRTFNSDSYYLDTFNILDKQASATEFMPNVAGALSKGRAPELNGAEKISERLQQREMQPGPAPIQM